MVAAGFYLVTQRGVFAREVSVYTPGSGTPLLYDTLKINESNLVLDTLKSTEKVETIPPRFNYELIMRVTYRPDITKHYSIYINPYTGDGCIEKGLLKKSYFMISQETMDFILSPANVSISKLSEPSENDPLDTDFYTRIRSTFEYIGGRPEIPENSSEYTISINSPLMGSLEYFLLLDLESEKAYAGTPEGYYSISTDMAESLFSMEPIYMDYKEKIQPIPDISLNSGIPIDPSYKDIRWIRIKPTGETVSESILESNRQEVESLEPGQLLAAVYKPGQKPDGIVLYEYRGGDLFKEYDLLNDEVVVPDFEGKLDYTLKAIYEISSYPKSYGTISLDYSFAQDLPTSVEMLYNEARPGDILAFFIDYSEDGESFSLESNLGNFKADFMPYGNSYVIYMPINWWTAPKDYAATIYRNIESGREVFEEYTVTILPDEFVTEYQYLEVSEELKEKTDPVKTANDSVLVAKAKSNPNPTSYVEGTFILPIEGELGTSYAMTRYVNGENPYRHSGLDIDGETGDPVAACNNGVIVYAGPLVRPGNTVIIDHGMGLYTSYLHLSGFAVEVGDYVEKGDVVAYVGSTGFSTGPHLHWSVTLYGNYMSPLWLVENPIVPD